MGDHCSVCLHLRCYSQSYLLELMGDLGAGAEGIVRFFKAQINGRHNCILPEHLKTHIMNMKDADYKHHLIYSLDHLKKKHLELDFDL